MINLQIDATLAAVLIGGLALATAVCLLVVQQLLRQQRQLSSALQRLGADVAVFSETSVAVAHTVEQALVLPAPAKNPVEPNVGNSRRELLAVAQRRIAQGQGAAQVQQALGLKNDECRLVCIGQHAKQAATPSADTQPAQLTNGSNDRTRHQAVA